VTDSVGNEFAAVTGYVPTGKIGHILYGNDVTTEYTYDGWSNRLMSIITNGPGGNPVLQDRSYGYSPAGDIELITDSVKSVSYYYDFDKLHRLTSETTSDGSIGLTPSILELYYDNPEHIHAVSSATPREDNHDYTYDANGNMQTGPDFTDPDQIAARTLAFNADNMPEYMAHASFGIVGFLYDGKARRAKKDGPSDTTYYLSNEIEIINGVPTCYIFAGNLRIAKITEANITYFHKDHLGSSTVMTDTSGAALETGGYLPYGIQRENPGITLSNYKFTDQELDTESGLYNYDARLYDPVIGRFISPDSIVPRPFDPQSLNRYSYCRNNPLIYTDPTGHSPPGIGDGIGNEPDLPPNDDSENTAPIPIDSENKDKEKSEAAALNLPLIVEALSAAKTIAEFLLGKDRVEEMEQLQKTLEINQKAAEEALELSLNMCYEIETKEAREKCINKAYDDRSKAREDDREVRDKYNELTTKVTPIDKIMFGTK